MIRVLLLAVALLLSADAVAQSMHYTVDVTDSRSKRVKVTLATKMLGAETVTFQMPAWAPGAYSVTNYGRFVQDLKAYNSLGNELPVARLNENRWSVAGGKSIAKIEYYVADSRKDSTSLWFALAHIDSNLFFANATALFGYVNDKKDLPSTVKYILPEGWELGNSLDLGDKKQKRDCSFTQTEFEAKDYDELVDAPVLAAPELQTRCFNQDGALYEIVVVSNRAFPMDSLEEATKRIVKVQTEFFNETPFKHYTFLYYAPTFMQMPTLGQGALEHMNSSAYLMMHQPWSQFKETGLRIISHEFFHLWNVKRIHSTLLGPFDYTQGVKTSSLWLSEGVTDYYAHALLARSGIISGEKFLSDVRDWYGSYRMSSAAQAQSLEQISLKESEFDMQSVVALYTKGPFVGLMLDAEIRSRTNNRKSLDDVMLALNKDAKKGKHFKDEELIGKIEKIVGLDLKDFHSRYIAGTDSIDLEHALNALGLTSRFDLSTELVQRGEEVAVEIETIGEQVVLRGLPITSFFKQAGFRESDTLLTLNGAALTKDNLKAMLRGMDTESDQVFTVRREGDEATIRFKPSVLIQQRTRGGRPLRFRLLEDQTPLQVAVRESIMGKLSD